MNYIINAFPNTTVLAKNGAIPGTPPSYAIVCLEKMVDEDVDLVFVEYIANSRIENVVKDSNEVKMYERLLRKLLHLPKKPAVVLMQVGRAGWGGGGGGGGVVCTVKDVRAWGPCCLLTGGGGRDPVSG